MESLNILHHIHLIRGQKIMLDADLAIIYDVSTKQLNQAIKRNQERFPDDFMFRLTDEEWEHLKSQFVTSSQNSDEATIEGEDKNEVTEADFKKVNWGGRRFAPYAFTEHGAIMLSSILRSERAVSAGIQVVRAFVRMRTMLETQSELSFRLQQLEAVVEGNFNIVFEAINELMAENAQETEERRMIGFGSDKK
jgi:L-lactate utilization protein LutC